LSAFPLVSFLPEIGNGVCHCDLRHSDDRIRHKVSERCKDYGLDRIQYSAFAGDLDRNRREELMLRLKKTLGKKEGNIRLQPVCTRDLNVRAR
jgi:CRISPR-associated protein Cas2